MDITKSAGGICYSTGNIRSIDMTEIKIGIKCAQCGKIHIYEKDDYIKCFDNVFCNLECKKRYYKDLFSKNKG